MRRLSPAVALSTAAMLLVAASVFGLASGAVDLPVSKIVSILLSEVGVRAPSDYPPWQATIVLDVRLPRVVAGTLVGGGLALSGAALQALFRNPLADPGVIGVSAGASLGAVCAMYLGFAATSVWAVPLAAIALASLTAFAVYRIALRRGRTPVGTLLLAGIAVGAFASALTSFVLSLSLDEYEQGRQMFRWLMGGLEARTWSEVALVTPTTLIGGAFVISASRELDAMLLGEVQAASVGVDVPRVRRQLIFATSLIVGGAVAVSGVIGFVGLVIPHVLRLLVGPVHAWLLPLCLVFGGAFLVGADGFARTVMAPEEMRLGVVTAAIGAPFFLFLLLQRKREVSIE